MVKKPTVIVFDIDGTLTKGYSWIKFNEIGGISREQDLKWQQDYIDGNLSYQDWVEGITKTYRKNNVTKTQLEQATQNIDFQDGVHELVNLLRKKYLLALASSSPNVFVEAVAKDLGISNFFSACHFEFDTKGRFTSIAYHGTDKQAKVDYLKKLARELDITVNQVYFVGDSENDLGAFELTGNGILVGKGNEKLRKAALNMVQELGEIPALFH